jgi:hypothetical protein
LKIDTIRTHADPVKVVNDSAVAGINVDLPCVDVTELGAGQGSASDGIADLLDVADKNIRSSTGVASSTVGRDTVKILRSNRDTNNQVSESGAVLGDGSLQGGDLVVKRLLAGGSPQTKEEGGLGIDSGLDRLNDSVLTAMLNHSI